MSFFTEILWDLAESMPKFVICSSNSVHHTRHRSTCQTNWNVSTVFNGSLFQMRIGTRQFILQLLVETSLFTIFFKFFFHNQAFVGFITLWSKVRHLRWHSVHMTTVCLKWKRCRSFIVCDTHPHMYVCDIHPHMYVREETYYFHGPHDHHNSIYFMRYTLYSTFSMRHTLDIQWAVSDHYFHGQHDHHNSIYFMRYTLYSTFFMRYTLYIQLAVRDHVLASNS